MLVYRGVCVFGIVYLSIDHEMRSFSATDTCSSL